MDRRFKNASVCGEVDFPNREHHSGSLWRTVSVSGVNLSTSVLSFRTRFFLILLESSLVVLVPLLDQNRQRLNLVGAFFPPENWMICHPSTLLFSPTWINSSVLSASVGQRKKHSLADEETGAKETQSLISNTQYTILSSQKRKQNHNHQSIYRHPYREDFYG